MREILAALVALLATPSLGQDWSGPYAGLSGGYLAGGYTDEFGGTVDYAGAGLGAFGGYRWGLDGVVIGAELAGRGHFMSQTDESLFFGKTGTASVSSFTLRGTLGLPLDRFLPYFAAGPTFIMQHVDPNSPTLGTDYQAHIGLDLAAGIDIPLTDQLFLRGEAGLAFGFGDRTYDLGGGQFRAGLEPQPRVELGVGLNF